MTHRQQIQWTWRIALALIAAFIMYWAVFAANRYVSEARVVVVSLQAPSLPALDLASMVTGAAPPKDILLLRDYLLSSDILRMLDEKLDLRGHYSDSFDVLSRMLRKDMPFEWFLRHYQNRVEADYDEYSGLLAIRAQAYTPQVAHAIATELVREGERFMNELAHRIAREQVAFAEREVADAAKRLTTERQTLLAFQNKHGLISPTATVESLSSVTARLEGELSVLGARRRALEAYLTPVAPELVGVKVQARAVEQQLASERTRLASSNGRTLNRVAEEYDRLLMEAGFQQDVYKTALAALERARIEASRTLKKVSVVQQPTLPQQSLEPARFYNIVVSLVLTLALTGITLLFMDIVREHQD